MSLEIWKQPFNDALMFPPLDSGWAIPSMLQSFQRGATKDFVRIMGTDLIETPTGYNVNVDLPGVDLSELDLSVVGNNLVIKAERKCTHDETVDRVHSIEKVYGKVERQIRLPSNANTDEVHTVFKNGVLSIEFPKMGSPAKKLHIAST
jgi:HSP20 family molecular chaperone IbpA